MDHHEEPSIEIDVGSLKSTMAFRNLPGAAPVELHLNRGGCSWPVYRTVRVDALAAPATTLQCGRQRKIRHRGFHPYCTAHCRIAYRPSHVR